MTEREPVAFELVDLTSGNVVNDFAQVSDALASIRKVARTHGWEAVGNLALLRLRGDDQTLVAMQRSLADLAASMEHATTAVGLLETHRNAADVLSRTQNASVDVLRAGSIAAQLQREYLQRYRQQMELHRQQTAFASATLKAIRMATTSATTVNLVGTRQEALPRAS